MHYTNSQPWTFTNGAHLAVVEVDVETGRVRVLRYVAVDDCGRIVNPALVEGQIAGGVAQGLGGALFEHCVVRRLRAAADGDADGLRRADRRRPAGVRAAPSGDAGAVDRRRVQGRGRSRDHRRAGGDPQRGERRARPVRRAASPTSRSRPSACSARSAGSAGSARCDRRPRAGRPSCARRRADTPRGRLHRPVRGRGPRRRGRARPSASRRATCT